MNLYQFLALNLSALPDSKSLPPKMENCHEEPAGGHIFSVLLTIDTDAAYFQGHPFWHCSAALMVNNRAVPIANWKDDHFWMAEQIVTENLRGVGDLTEPDKLLIVKDGGVAFHCRRLLTTGEVASFEYQIKRLAIMTDSPENPIFAKTTRKSWWRVKKPDSENKLLPNLK